MQSHNLVTLLLLYLVINERIASLCKHSSQHTLINGRILDGHPFWESKTGAVTECAQSCVRMKKCKSFNFRKLNGLCQLNSEEGTRTTLDKHFVYSRIADWPSQIDPSCFRRPCAEDEVCIPGHTTDGTSCVHSCMKMEHKCPPPEGTLSSQPRTVGSVYNHTCPRGYKGGGDSALCLPTRKWNKPIDTTCTRVYGSRCEDDTDCESVGAVCIDHACACNNRSRYDSIETVCVEVCERDWIVFEDKCYYFGDQEIDFYAASAFCSDKGGHLVQIDTYEQNEFLKSVMLSLPTKPFQGYWNDLVEWRLNEPPTWYTTGDPLTFTVHVATLYCENDVMFNPYNAGTEYITFADNVYQDQPELTCSLIYDWAPNQPTDSFMDNVFALETCHILQALDFYTWHDIHCSSACIPTCEKATIL